MSAIKAAGLIAAAALVATVVLHPLAAAAAVLLASPAGYHRLRLSRWAARRDMVGTMRRRTFWFLRPRPGPGFAPMLHLLTSWSRTCAALSHGNRARPGTTRWQRLTSPVTSYAIPLGRSCYGKRIFASLEEIVLYCSLPRQGKTSALARRIAHHQGACVAASSKPDLYWLTVHRRRRQGPVHVFNPGGFGQVTSTMRWNILAGCEDEDTACRRAADLTGKQYAGRGDMQFWISKATVALAALMHAAALGGRTILDVTLWADKDGTQDAVDILRRHRPGGLLAAKVQELRATTGSGRIADSIRTTITEALAFCTVPKLLESATPGGPGEQFNVYEFLRRHGTLYMIAGDDAGNLATLFRAFAAYIHYEAGLTGSNAPAGKLDPPVLFALDEVTQICPVPLPRWVADSAGKGIVLAIVAHTKTQLAERWGTDGADTIWSNCGVKVLFRGHGSGLLEEVSGLYGRIPVTGHEDKRDMVPVAPAPYLFQLPRWWALVVRAGYPPVVAKMPQPYQLLPARIVARAAAALEARRAGTVAAQPTTAPVVPVTPPTIEFPVADPQLLSVDNGNGHHRSEEETGG